MPSLTVPTDTLTDISTFQGVVSIVLKDGQITREEKRLIIKLASLLNLDADSPKRVYDAIVAGEKLEGCLLYTSPSPRDATLSRMPSSA